ncbi:MAG: hypothetical protein QXV32_00070 [Conexivisphaerales archaeon]
MPAGIRAEGMSEPARSLGISAPEGENVYEVYIKVASRPSILGKISDIMGQRNIDIIGAHVQVSDDKTLGFILLYIELAKSKSSINEVLDTLRKQDYVKEAIAQPRNEVFFEGIMYPLTSGGHYKVFALGTTIWSAIVKSLYEMFGQTAGFVLRNEGNSAGKAAVRRIEGRFTTRGMKIPDRNILIENVKVFCKASGLGVVEIEGEAPRLKATISSSLLSDQAGMVDDFMIGLVKGAMEQIYGLNFLIENIELKDGQTSFEIVST